MAAELKPKTKKAAKAKSKSKEKKKDVKKTFIIKKHKRKSSSGEIRTFAICDAETSKQLLQLSSNACSTAEEIVTQAVESLNKGNKTVDDVKKELDAIKAGQS